MGDRCYMRIDFRAIDQEKFEDRFGKAEQLDEVDEYGLILRGCWQEVNYGGYTDREELSGEGIPFTGYHSEGCEYDAYLFASTDQESQAECPCDKEEQPVARVAEGPEGTVIFDHLAAETAAAYFEHLHRATAVMQQQLLTDLHAAHGLRQWLGYQRDEDWRGQFEATKALGTWCDMFTGSYYWGRVSFPNDNPMTYPGTGPNEGHIYRWNAFLERQQS